MDLEKEVTEAFPEMSEIRDQELRRKTIETWVDGLAESKFGSIHEIPQSPKYDEYLGPRKMVAHVRSVTAIAIQIARMMDDWHEEAGISQDIVVAGALLHDVSKIYESTPRESDETTTVDQFLGHPYFGIHMAQEHGLPEAIQHVILTHTSRTAVSPQTMEAMIVSVADQLASQSMYWMNTDTMKYRFRNEKTGQAND